MMRFPDAKTLLSTCIKNKPMGLKGGFLVGNSGGCWRLFGVSVNSAEMFP